MNKFTISEMDSINFSLHNEGGCPLNIESSQVDGGSSFSTLRACPLSVVDFAQRPKSGDTQSSAMVRLSFKVNDGHLFDPSITIICRCMPIRTWPKRTFYAYIFSGLKNKKLVQKLFNSIRDIDWCMLKGVFKNIFYFSKKRISHFK